MESASPTDSRGYFLIPQSYEGGGYYVYGTPDKGLGQYAHPQLISALLEVARSWSHLDKRKFGVGNVSLAGGEVFLGHRSHRSGLEVVSVQSEKMEIACPVQSLTSNTIAMPRPL
jgi:murein endopeptidase